MDHRLVRTLSRWCPLAALALTACSTTEPTQRASVLANPFFAMDTALTPKPGKVDATVLGRIELVRDLGYEGVGWRVDGLTEVRDEASRLGLPLVAVYARASIDDAEWALFRQLCEQMGGTGTALWLAIDGREHPRSSPAGDERAVRLLRDLAQVAEQHGVRIALYPHSGFWMERTDDAVRIADAVGLANVGVTFNLCHWLKVEPGAELGATLDRALPRLFFVTIHGADPGDDWSKLIQPLDRGSFDVRELLGALEERGYTGPIGLQAYGVAGSPDENLRRSMEAWREMSGAAQ